MTEMGEASQPLRIGLSACFFHADPQRAVFKGKTLLYAEQSMVQWVMSRGALVYMIPTAPDLVRAHEYMADLDALVLQGGSDVAPQSYGETPLRPEWCGDYIRDCYEIELLKSAVALNRPVLGVCRGAQLINVGLGGTMLQDITLQRPGSLVHRDWDIYDQNFHAITLAKDSYLAAMYQGAVRGRINSVHHQAIKQLAPGLEIQAQSEPDDIVESIWLSGGHDVRQPYVLGVQWHPEFQASHDTTLLDRQVLLDDFLAAATLRRQASRGKRHA